MGIQLIDNLSGGQNQRTAPHLIADNQFEILVNISQDYLGALSNRPGAVLFLNQISASNPIRGLHSYTKDDGNFYLHAVHQGNLYVSGGATWTSQQASLFATSSTVEFTNYINRHYLIGSGNTEYLSYVTDTGSATVVSGSIEGKYLASNGTRLMVAGGTTNARRVYFSNVNSDTFTTTRDYIDATSLPTGVASFGSGRPFVIFTKDGYLEADPDRGYASENLGGGFGCAAHRSIQTVRGNIIWLSRDGTCFYALAANQAVPTEISLPIENNATGDAIIDKIDGSNWTLVASGSYGNKYFCALRNLSGTVKGQTLNDCVLEYDFSQNSWRTHTYTTGGLASVFANHIVSGEMGLYAGSLDNGAVYRIDQYGQSGDDNSLGSEQDVTRLARMKHYLFIAKNQSIPMLKKVRGIYFQYYCESGKTVTVKFSKDNATTYTDTKTLSATESGQDWAWAHVLLGFECKSLGVEISWTGDVNIFGIAFDVEDTDVTGIKAI